MYGSSRFGGWNGTSAAALSRKQCKGLTSGAGEEKNGQTQVPKSRAGRKEAFLVP